jgi:putative DNA methylase
MTQSYKKKLIEVAIPLEAINAASAREKSIRHGHPSTMHLWWARRPLAACRAVLFAQLVDDPSSHPDKFPTEEAVDDERKRLFAIIEELVIWENSTNEEVLERARKEIRKSCDGELPPVYDPFSGGCSIPLEAQRLGLPAYGSDLNPVAVMIGKAMIEIPPKFKDMEPVHPGIKDRSIYRNSEGLAEDIKYYGDWMHAKVKERIGHLYPQLNVPIEHGGGQATVVAWIWARTVPSPDPAFNEVKIPLVSSFLLNNKKGKEVWLQPLVDKKEKSISWRIRKGGTKEDIDNAKLGTSAGKRQAFYCLFSGAAVPYSHIRAAGKNGLMNQELIAIIAEGNNGRIYCEPNSTHKSIASSCKPEWRPDIELPANPRDFKTPNYGLNTFGDLFTDRQLVALNTFSDVLNEVRSEIKSAGITAGLANDNINLRDEGKEALAYSEAISIYLAFAIDRLADAGSSIATWSSSGFIRFTFARQALPMTWDFAECNFLSNSTGNFKGAVNWVFKAVAGLTPNSFGHESQQSAQNVKLPEGAVISTDPPYYDNIGYADLSDFFFVWMRKNIKKIFPELTATLSVPKSEELIASPYRHGGKIGAENHFHEGMTTVLSSLSKQASTAYPAAIYYAFKQSEIEKDGLSSKGWSTFLEAIIQSGYTIVGTWPVRTERAARTIASGTNALANSVVLVCRRKEASAESITRAEFIRLLKSELPLAITELQTSNVSPADIPQSAIGPGMGAFSRFTSVLETDDSHMTVKTALQLINAELDEFLNDLQGDFDPETRFSATWFEQNGYEKGDFGAANSLATARGIAVESVKHAGIVESSAGKVRILKREELDPNWEPNSDTHLTIWECCQYLVREYEDGGETSAAMLIKKMGYEKAETVKDLAYYLYDICSNKRQDAKEATSYNALISGWNDIMRMANSIHDTDTTRQASLF